MSMASKNKFKVSECLITRHEVYTADECFLTGTAAEIVPVIKVDARIIGSGKPGVVTKKMLALFRAATKTKGVKYTV